MKIPIFDHVVVHPLAELGFTGGFWSIHLDTLIYTWVAMILLFSIVLAGGVLLKKYPDNVFSHILEQAIDFFASLCIESFGGFRAEYFTLVSTLFFFVLACNTVAVLPFIEESTRDLNTTIAVALMSFFYIEGQKIRHNGIGSYLLEYIQPIFKYVPIPVFFPINVIEKLGKIVSMSFRLFGNILGGSIVYYLLIHVISLYKWWFMAGACTFLVGYWILTNVITTPKLTYLRSFFKVGWLTLYCLAGVQMFFGIFEGVIQAFVVAMLTVTYLSVVLGGTVEEEQQRESV